jgi:hypothetical protein
VIGAWSHRFLNHTSPYCRPKGKVRPPAAELWQEALEYLDHHSKGTGDPAHSDKRLFYYTLGEEACKGRRHLAPAGRDDPACRWFRRGRRTAVHLSRRSK